MLNTADIIILITSPSFGSSIAITLLYWPEGAADIITTALK